MKRRLENFPIHLKKWHSSVTSTYSQSPLIFRIEGPLKSILSEARLAVSRLVYSLKSTNHRSNVVRSPQEMCTDVALHTSNLMEVILKPLPRTHHLAQLIWAYPCTVTLFVDSVDSEYSEYSEDSEYSENSEDSEYSEESEYSECSEDSQHSEHSEHSEYSEDSVNSVDSSYFCQTSHSWPIHVDFIECMHQWCAAARGDGWSRAEA